MPTGDVEYHTLRDAQLDTGAMPQVRKFTLCDLFMNHHKWFHPQVSNTLVGIMKSMIDPDPSKRPTCEQLLQHPAVRDVGSLGW